ncbi:dehydrogenase/reductase SDR family member 4-like [Mizuhopecten yessoensis]|uniref:dehydrogenase/reductase SDR family member 4-like n=1 Tax=Mizuhopecten yessoensis TaxID=6573 RepID=UPI000B45793C|nr:dehydrogenase/reductase SDR family member 4-like [Mizuhopecten yessoensis]
MAQKLAGKIAVVTASTDGIGYAIAERLAQDGAKVVISSRKQTNVDAAVKKLKSQKLDVVGVVCHVGKKEDRENLVATAIEKYGGIDIFVSNAAVNPFFGPILDCTESAWDKIFDINVKTAFLLCKDIVPHMQKRGGGSIILVSSIGGYEPSALMGPYSVSKTAVLGLKKALVHQLSPMNIRVNCLAPGLIKTRFSEALWKDPDNMKLATQNIKLGRIGKPEECAGIVSFLSSDDASFITDETIKVSGGASSQL